jgi:hypothetical protein
MHKSEAAALIRALKIMNGSLERIEKIVGRVLSGSIRVGGKRHKRSAELIVMKRR